MSRRLARGRREPNSARGMPSMRDVAMTLTSVNVLIGDWPIKRKNHSIVLTVPISMVLEVATAAPNSPSLGIRTEFKRALKGTNAMEKMAATHGFPSAAVTFVMTMNNA